jgi:hypothetical protein
MPSYRFDDAIKAGVPISDINREAAKRIGYRYDDAVAAGVSDDDILAELQKRYSSQEPAKEQKTPGPDVLGAIRTGMENVAGGVVGVGDFLYGGVKAIPQALIAAGAVLGGNKATDVEKFLMPELAEKTEAVAPSLGKIIEKFGVDPKKVTQTEGYKTMHDKPMEAIGEILQYPGRGVRAMGGDEELAAGSNIAAMAGLVGAPFVKGLAPKAPVNPLSKTIGFPFNKSEVPNNFVGGSTAAVQKLNREAEIIKKKTEEKAAEEAAATPHGDVIGKQFGGREAKPWDTPEEARVKSSFEMELVPQGEPGLFEQPKTPDASLLVKRHDIPEATIDFPLRQEVLQQPEIVAAIEAFRTKASELQKVAENAISEKVRENAARELETLQQEFAAGMKQLGVDDAAGAHGLNRPLYEQTGGKTQLPVETTTGTARPPKTEQTIKTPEVETEGWLPRSTSLGGTGKRGFGQGGALDLSVFTEGLNDLNRALSNLTDKIADNFRGVTMLRNSDGTPSVFLHATRKDFISRNSKGYEIQDAAINPKLVDKDSFDPRNISPRGDLGIHLGNSATSAHVRIDGNLTNIGSTKEGFVKPSGWENVAGDSFYSNLNGPSLERGSHIFPYVVKTTPDKVVSVSKDINNWADPINVITQLEKDGVIPKSAFRTETGYLKVPTIIELRNELVRRGIYVIEYPNTYEAIGAAKGTPKSIVVLKKSILEPLSDARIPKLGGPGKKQGGAVNFGAFRRDKDTREKVSIEGLQAEYKRVTGKELSVEKAIEWAKEANYAIEEVSTKLKNKGGGFAAFNKKIGNPFTDRDTLTPDEMKIAFDEGLVRDIDTNILKQALSAPVRAGGDTYRVRNYYNNPLVEALLRPLSRAADAAKYRADHILWGKEGVGTQLRNLTREEYDAFSLNLLKYRGTNDVAAVLEGLTPAARKAGEAYLKATEKDLASKNAARALEGKKPLTGPSVYLAGSWQGDRVFTVHDKSGELVGVVTGYASDLATARKWIVENRPDHTMTPEISNVRVERGNKQQFITDNLAELYDAILEANKSGEISLQDAVYNAMVEQRNLQSAKVRGVHLHEKFRKETPVFGAEGFKPWLDKSKNADELFASQVRMIEDSILREELSKAAKNISDYEQQLGNLNAIKLAKRKLGDMQGNYDPIGVKYMEQRIRGLVSDSGKLGEWGLKGFRWVEPATTAAMNTVYFSLNAMHALLNIAEVPRNTLLGIQEGGKAAPNVWKQTVGTFGAIKGASHMALLAAEKAGGPKMAGDYRYFHDYAMKQNVGNPTVEVRQSVSPESLVGKAGTEVMSGLNATISVPEIAGRYTSFVTIAHALKSMGLDKVHAADLAHDLVKKNFKDYSKLEASPVFQRLGTLGMGGRQLRTWLIGETLNHYSALINRQPLILGTMIASTALIYGADSVPMFKQFDEWFNTIREFAISKAKDPKQAQEFADYQSPREWLYTHPKVNGDLRGGLDRLLEYAGAEGSSMGNTEYRLFPQDWSEWVMKVKYMLSMGKSADTILTELKREDTNWGAVARNVAEPFAPKMATRLIEDNFLKDEQGNILNEKNEYNPKVTLNSPEERKAYALYGMQPKTTALNRTAEGFQFRKQTNVNERQQAARDQLVEAFNNLQVNPKATARYDKAREKFIAAYGGSDNSDESFVRSLQNAIETRAFTPMQKQRIAQLKKPENNPEMVDYYTQILKMSSPGKPGLVGNRRSLNVAPE